MGSSLSHLDEGRGTIGRRRGHGHSRLRVRRRILGRAWRSLLPPLPTCAEEMRQAVAVGEMRREVAAGERRRARRWREGRRRAGRRREGRWGVPPCKETKGAPPDREGRGPQRRSEWRQRGVHAAAGEEHRPTEGRQWRELVVGGGETSRVTKKRGRNEPLCVTSGRSVIFYPQSS
jgi:hypothetical protein